MAVLLRMPTTYGDATVLKYATILLPFIKVMPYYIIKCYLLLKLASYLRTRTTMEISSTPIAFCVFLGIIIMCNTIITV